jgi:addiction module HigA family antidote
MEMPKTSKSSTITDEKVEIVGVLPPLHPGEVLREEFLVPLGLTAYAAARACRVPRTRIERLAREETPITADTALRLARFLGTTADFWLGLQMEYDLRSTARGLKRDLGKIVPLRKQAA